MTIVPRIDEVCQTPQHFGCAARHCHLFGRGSGTSMRRVNIVARLRVWQARLLHITVDDRQARNRTRLANICLFLCPTDFAIPFEKALQIGPEGDCLLRVCSSTEILTESLNGKTHFQALTDWESLSTVFADRPCFGYNHYNCCYCLPIFAMYFRPRRLSAWRLLQK